MIDFNAAKTVHAIGIGGIHVSAVARLLVARGITVTGSDTVSTEETDRLIAEGISVIIGDTAQNIPANVDLVIYSDAVPSQSPERQEVARRGIPSFDTHLFLGMLFQGARQVVITGSHGKSTTTAMVANILEAAGADPTVVVGTRVPGFAKGNLRIGRSDLLVVEGDEYQSHVLSYNPTILAITNIEWDHPDVFPTAASYDALFAEVIARVGSQGTVVRDVPMNTEFHLQIPGEMNVRNASLALATALAFDPSIDRTMATATLNAFPGVWRRFERVGELNGAPVISDYGHHPTEVHETLKAARSAYAHRRLVLCYQPHQHARTKGLLKDFVRVLAEPDVLILAEIYDVPGRKEEQDAHVSSRQILEQLQTPLVRSYASDVADAERQLRNMVQPQDVVLVMGAGPIDVVARRLVQS
jgi:UDP-N-acetylmuramate--alanine ligase